MFQPMTYVCTPPSPCHAQACGIASHAQLMGMTKEDMRAAGVSVAVRTHPLKASAQYRPPPASSGDGPGDGGGRDADAHVRTETEIAVPAALTTPQIINEFNTLEETKIMSNAAADTADIDFVVEQTGVDRTRAVAALDKHQEPTAAIFAIQDEQKAERARAQPPPQLEARQASTAARRIAGLGDCSGARGEVGGDLIPEQVLSDGPPSEEEEGDAGGGMAADERSTSNNNVATAGAVAEVPRGGVGLHVCESVCVSARA